MGLRTAVKFMYLAGWGGSKHVPNPIVTILEAYAKYLRIRLGELE
jgi:hypothetical protein